MICHKVMSCHECRENVKKIIILIIKIILGTGHQHILSIAVLLAEPWQKVSSLIGCQKLLLDFC